MEETTEQKNATIHSHTLPSNNHSDLSPAPTTTPVIHSTQPHLSTMVRMTLNNTHANATTLWTPDGLHKHHTLPKPQNTGNSLSTQILGMVLPPICSPSQPMQTIPATKYTTHTHATALIQHFPWQAIWQCQYQHPPSIPWPQTSRPSHNMQLL